MLGKLRRMGWVALLTMLCALTIPTPAQAGTGVVVRGKIINEKGQGEPGVSLTLSRITETGFDRKRTTSLADGSFSFNDVVADSYVLTLQKEGVEFDPNEIALTVQDTEVVVESPEVRHTPPLNGTITGRVLLRDSRTFVFTPLPNVTVSLIPTSDVGQPTTPIPNQITNAKGEYTFKNIPFNKKRSFSVKATVKGQPYRFDQTQSATLDAQDTQFRVLDIVARRIAELNQEISGIVRLKGAKTPLGIKGITVRLQSEPDAFVEVDKTSKTGSVGETKGKFTFLAPGKTSYTVSIDDTGDAKYYDFPQLPNPVVVKDKRRSDVNIDAVPKEFVVPGELRDTLRKEGIGAYPVTLKGTSAIDGAPVLRTTKSEPDGTYEFRNIVAGTYTVRVESSDKAQFTKLDSARISPGALVETLEDSGGRYTVADFTAEPSATFLLAGKDHGTITLNAGFIADLTLTIDPSGAVTGKIRTRNSKEAILTGGRVDLSKRVSLTQSITLESPLVGMFEDTKNADKREQIDIILTGSFAPSSDPVTGRGDTTFTTQGDTTVPGDIGLGLSFKGSWQVREDD